jgi:hypothetical protein
MSLPIIISTNGMFLRLSKVFAITQKLQLGFEYTIVVSLLAVSITV